MNWKIISTILLSSSLIIIGADLVWDKNHVHVSRFPDEQTQILRKATLIDPFLAHTLYQMMKDTHEVLERVQIPYWVDGGTLLGAVRHRGITPWNDDLDIGVPMSYKKKVTQLSQIFQVLGYQFYPSEFGYKLSPLVAPIIAKDAGLYPVLNIFFFHQERATDRFVQTSEIARKKWPNSWYASDEIYKIDLIPFGSFHVHAPSNRSAYLTRFYGSDWDTKGVFIHRNMSNVPLPNFFWTLEPEDLEPAQPSNSAIERVKNNPKVKILLDQITTH